MNFDQQAIALGCWMSELDQIVSDSYGCSISDIPDIPIRKWYSQGMTPAEAAILCEELAT